MLLRVLPLLWQLWGKAVAGEGKGATEEDLLLRASGHRYWNHAVSAGFTSVV